MTKKVVTLAAAFMLIVTFSFSQKDYQMWETTYITPKAEKMAELKKGMAEHNKKFHNDGPYLAHVWNIYAGYREGEWLWAMGPCTWTHLDDRPDSKEHNEDWQNNVVPYVEKFGGSQYWKLNAEVSTPVEGEPEQNKALWTAYDLKPFEGYRFIEMLRKVKKVYDEKSYPHSMFVYEAELDDGSGRDVLIGWYFEKYAWFDRDSKFWRDYEEVHGEGTWRLFMEEFRDVVKGQTDQLAEFQKELSGGQ